MIAVKAITGPIAKSYRQGDIYFKPITEQQYDEYLSTSEAEEVKPIGHFFKIVEGAATGHVHGIVKDMNTQVKLYRVKNAPISELYLHCSNDVRNTHDEHNEIQIIAGYYKIVRGRFFDNEMARQIED